jgi:hypothetical protein
MALVERKIDRAQIHSLRAFRLTATRLHLDFGLKDPSMRAIAFHVLTTIAAAPPLLQRTKKPRPVPAEEQDFFPASEVV